MSSRNETVNVVLWSVATRTMGTKTSCTPATMFMRTPITREVVQWKSFDDSKRQRLQRNNRCGFLAAHAQKMLLPLTLKQQLHYAPTFLQIIPYVCG